MTNILLASDLDRTIVPNGKQEESEGARERLDMLVKRPEVTLAYVSGRGRDLLQEAIETYKLPVPDFAIGDVGTTIYEVGERQAWEPVEAWQKEIASDWNGRTWEDITRMYSDISEIWLQDDNPAAQNTFKASYFTDMNVDRDSLLERMYERAHKEDIKPSLIFSVDEEKEVGLLDVLPLSATKLHAIEFLMKMLQHTKSDTVFAGDSGNDIPALTSGLQAVLVKNARDDVKEEVLSIVKEKGIEDMLYIAKGDFLGMNGNYSAGVLEGVAHYLPQTVEWMR